MALFNSTVLVAISAYIIVEAIGRLLNPQPVHGLLVIGFAAAALVFNTLSAVLLGSHGHDLNLRSAFLHLVGDALTSLGVMIAGLIVYLWNWNYADAIVSVLVALWIGRAAYTIVKSAVNVLMEGTPEDLELTNIEGAMLTIPGVKGVHDLHVWSLSSNDLALSAHVEIEDEVLSQTNSLLVALKGMLEHDFAIGHATLEPEPVGGECAGGTCTIVPA